ncbi:MAG: hypothetical protein ABSG25_12095 [Bryobacteraceae bacterium]
MANSILDYTPESLSIRVQQYLQVFETVYHESADSVMELVRNIFNTEYNMPEEVNYMLFALFGFIKPDLSYFTAEERTTIANNYADNIFIINRDKIKIDIFKHILYIYMLTGNIYSLLTYDFSNFVRRNDTFSEELKYTDMGLTTDIGKYTDVFYNTPFIEIEIILNKEYSTGYLWFNDIDVMIKKEMDIRRYLLTKIFYTLNCPIVGEVNNTITGINNVITYTSSGLTNLFDVTKYIVVFNDSTTQTLSIDPDNLSEDPVNFYYIFETSFTEEKNITGLIVANSASVEFINCEIPDIDIKAGDKILFSLSIAKA